MPERQIALIRDYAGLVQALRTRRDELGLTHETVDELANLASGHASKLFTNPPMKRLGFISFGSMLFAHGVALVMIEDPRALEAIRGQYSKRTRRKHRIASMAPAPWLLDSEKARAMNRLRNQKLPAKRRSAIARKAAKRRWKRPRVEEVIFSASREGCHGANTSPATAPQSAESERGRERTAAHSEPKHPARGR